MRKGQKTSVLLIVATALTASLRAQWKAPWSYEGAEHWANLGPECAACKAGKAGLYPRDVRPLQPLNGRVVKQSQ